MTQTTQNSLLGDPSPLPVEHYLNKLPHEDYISYDILDDGTCSYCGCEAEMVQTPEGVWPSDRCQRCDQFNDGLLAGEYDDA